MKRLVFIFLFLFAIVVYIYAKDFGFGTSTSGLAVLAQNNTFTGVTNTFRIIAIDSLTFNANAGGTPVSNIIGGAAAQYFGQDYNTALGNPDLWLEINIRGTLYLLPCYTKP